MGEVAIGQRGRLVHLGLIASRARWPGIDHQNALAAVFARDRQWSVPGGGVIAQIALDAVDADAGVQLCAKGVQMSSVVACGVERIAA
jgi:hypothetical protein